MPNWCDNTLEVSHKDPVAMKRLVDAFKAGRLCEEFIPSPNGEWSYDFSVDKWGTKWDVGGDEGGYIQADDTSASISFQSAWSPPMGLYPVLESLGYTVRAMYYEPGCAFAGVYEDGYDECYPLDGSADLVEETIPAELDEAFGIVESMRQFEENDE